jgi:hypothetical protein
MLRRTKEAPEVIVEVAAGREFRRRVENIGILHTHFDGPIAALLSSKSLSYDGEVVSVSVSGRDGPPTPIR